jgi:glutathione S-transferase
MVGQGKIHKRNQRVILYGRDLSPFTRRVAIWCALQGRPVERRETSVVGPEFEEIKAHNPVARVPILILDDGTHLIESFAICDYLDETAPNGTRLVPDTMVYERNRRPEEFHWRDWQQRVASQVQGGLTELDRVVPEEGWSGEGGPDGGDIAAIIAYQFVETTNPWLLEPGYPRLAALAARGMEIDAIAATKPAA